MLFTSNSDIFQIISKATNLTIYMDKPIKNYNYVVKYNSYQKRGYSKIK